MVGVESGRMRRVENFRHRNSRRASADEKVPEGSDLRQREAKIGLKGKCGRRAQTEVCGTWREMFPKRQENLLLR